MRPQQLDDPCDRLGKRRLHIERFFQNGVHQLQAASVQSLELDQRLIASLTRQVALTHRLPAIQFIPHHGVSD